MRNLIFSVSLLIAVLCCGCARHKIMQPMVTTGYCGCGQCCGWERGAWKYLKLDFWNRYVSDGIQEGQTYTGRTAGGTKPHEPRPGLFSFDSLKHPWMIPARIIFFPWLLMPRDGTLAADTDYYRFGSRMYVEGYGWGVVEDRGGAIKGPRRLDLYFNSHGKALNWGKRTVRVRLE